jgi:hypothetical protein
MLTRLSWPRILIGVLVALLAIESAWIWPHYLAYFNQLIGGPKHGYKYLVDSSLDWGQDLPHLKRWIDENVKESEDVYLAYFGNNVVQDYGVHAIRIADDPGWGRTRIEPNLGPGVYCISASMLQRIYTKARGPWRPEYERVYRKLFRTVPDLLRDLRDPEANRRLVAKFGQEYLSDVITTFEHLRFARLAAYLLQEEPDDSVGYSVLIYRLTSDDIRKALYGPPAELKEAPVPPP